MIINQPNTVRLKIHPIKQGTSSRFTQEDGGIK